MPPENVIIGLVNLGLGGIFLFLFIAGYVHPKSTLDREVKRGDIATEALAKTSEALKSMGDTMNNAFMKELNSLRQEVVYLREEVRQLRSEK